VSSRASSKDVFINCPFDDSFRPIFDAIVFAVYDLGFVARCALEIDDASEVTLEKIKRIIAQCPYGIHDISSVSWVAGQSFRDSTCRLSWDCSWDASSMDRRKDRNKACPILDSEPYRYRVSISDISGQVIHSHGGSANRVILEVRNWLVAASRTKSLPGGAEVSNRYATVQERIARDLQAAEAQAKRPDFLGFFRDCRDLAESRSLARILPPQ